jgi:hypothetical protein
VAAGILDNNAGKAWRTSPALKRMLESTNRTPAKRDRTLAWIPDSQS